MQIPTPSLPVPLPKNASLSFVSQTYSETEFDEETGNPELTESTVAVEAYLKPSRDPREIAIATGINPSAIYLKGRAVDPVRLPTSIKHGDRAQLTLRNLIGSRTVTGEFIFYTSVVTFSEDEKVGGDRIQGVFIQIGGT